MFISVCDFMSRHGSFTCAEMPLAANVTPRLRIILHSEMTLFARNMNPPQRVEVVSARLLPASRSFLGTYRCRKKYGHTVVPRFQKLLGILVRRPCGHGIEETLC